MVRHIMVMPLTPVMVKDITVVTQTQTVIHIAVVTLTPKMVLHIPVVT